MILQIYAAKKLTFVYIIDVNIITNRKTVTFKIIIKARTFLWLKRVRTSLI